MSNMDISKRFGAHVRRLRRDKEITQEELAHEAGIHRTYLTELEGAKGRTPSLDVAYRLARALGTTLTAILNDIEEP